MTDTERAPITTEDGRIVHRGDRVFNYYDCWWGEITTEPDDDGWFLVVREDVPDEGTTRNTALLNGERISTYKPGWMR